MVKLMEKDGIICRIKLYSKELQKIMKFKVKNILKFKAMED
jgi:hypothetical protein